MSTMRAQTAVMVEVATRFDDAHQLLRHLLDQLLREIDLAKMEWQGRGGTTFEQVGLSWVREQRRLLDALEQTAESIRHAGVGYEAADAATAARLRATSISLPL